MGILQVLRLKFQKFRISEICDVHPCNMHIYTYIAFEQKLLIIDKCLSCWLVGFVALRPKSTAMVIAGRSVHLTTLFLGQA